MSGTPPKILDYQNPIPDIEVSSMHSILWPCNAVKVTLPVVKEREMNVLEETVLRLIETGMTEPEIISEATCLEEDLVHFILGRLVEHGLIDDRNQITGVGKIILGSFATDKTKFEARTVFVDLIEGKLLTGVLDELEFANVDNTAGGYGIKFDERKTGARQLAFDRRFLSKIPSPVSVSRMVRTFNRLHERQAFLGSGASELPKVRGRPSSVKVIKGAELVYLHVRLIVQRGTDEYRVSDPFFNGFSDVLEEIHGRYLGLHEAEAKQVDSLLGMAGRIIANPPSVVPGFKSFGNFPELQRNLSKAEGSWGKYNHLKGAATDLAAKESERAIGRCVAELYEAVEWTLRKLVEDYPTEKFIRLFGMYNSSAEKNLKIIGAYARKVGFEVSAESRSLLLVPPGKIKHALNNLDPEMGPLLGLAIAQAWQDGLHPMNAVAEKEPSFLITLARMKKVRDQAEHGDNPENDGEIESLATAWREKVHSFAMVLPGVELEGKPQKAKGEDGSLFREAAYNKQIQARRKLNDYFGYQKVQLFEEMFRNLLKEIEMEIFALEDIESESEIGCGTIIKGIASALQIAIHQSFIEKCAAFYDFQEDDSLTELAAQRATEIGFALDGDVLPKNLATVNPRRIQSALEGMNSTLGANLLALLLKAPAKWLGDFAETQKDFIQFIDQVIRERVHGNQSIYLAGKKILEIKEKAYQSIKQLREDLQ